MKKVFTLLLTLCMVLSAVCVSAYAAYMDDANHVTDDTAGNTSTAGIEATGYDKGDEIGTADIPVYITTTTTTSLTNVYAISYDVSELAYEYNGTEDTIWNPETLMYETTIDGSWAATSQDITVKNYSDIPVKVTPTNTTPAIEGVGVTLGEALELDSAFDGDVDTAGTVKSGTIAVTVTGAPVNKYPTSTLLTTVTLTVVDNRP